MAKKSKLKLWISGARLRTLPLAVAPIALGAGVAELNHAFNPWLTILALAVAVFLQIAVNYANDYSDGIRGTDAKRVGPMRLTGSKAVAAVKVRNVAFGFFGLAALAGLAVTAITGHWWFLVVGALAILAAWYYTGGKHPYGYAGLGELVVFIFFGLVATMGTAYIQVGGFEGNSLVGGVALGLLASAVLMVNNIRDLELDQHVGKKTLAVKVGRRAAIAIYLVMLWLPMLLLVPFTLLYPATVLGYACLLLLLPITLIVTTAKTPRELILALKLTSFAALGYGVLLGWGLALVNFG